VIHELGTPFKKQPVFFWDTTIISRRAASTEKLDDPSYGKFAGISG